MKEVTADHGYGERRRQNCFSESEHDARGNKNWDRTSGHSSVEPLGGVTERAAEGMRVKRSERSRENTEEGNEEDDFQVLNPTDAVEAINAHLCQYITHHPATNKMSPDQLKQALLETLQKLEQDATQDKRTDLISRARKYASSTQLSALACNAVGMYQGSWFTRVVLGGIMAMTFSKSPSG